MDRKLGSRPLTETNPKSTNDGHTMISTTFHNTMIPKQATTLHHLVSKVKGHVDAHPFGIKLEVCIAAHGHSHGPTGQLPVAIA